MCRLIPALIVLVPKDSTAVDSVLRVVSMPLFG